MRYNLNQQRVSPGDKMKSFQMTESRWGEVWNVERGPRRGNYISNGVRLNSLEVLINHDEGDESRSLEHLPDNASSPISLWIKNFRGGRRFIDTRWIE